jgi:hypothetical protein
MSLSYIGQQFLIYGGFFFLLIGIVGNGMNIFIFSTVHGYRTTPCTFYFLIASIVNMFYILINFTTRIAGAISGVDFTTISITWCKIRQFFIVALSLITLTCSCLATIDQFLTISRSVRLRRCSKIEWAHRIILVVIIVWFLHAIPCLLFYDILPVTNKCGITNAVYVIYNRIYLLGLLCIIPITIMAIFGYLTYRNIRQTRVLAEQNADGQLARMTLFQVLLVAFCLIPYSSNSAYGLITGNVAKDANRLLKENFAATIFTLITYIYYSVCLVVLHHIISYIFFLNSFFREVVTYF